MCGICGKIYFEHRENVDEGLIRNMCDVITHRGPDEHGYYIKGNVGLGHRRLSIIDLSTGQQPMSNARQDIWIVYNGEVYNFLELRTDLRNRGYAFQTTSDTEVIIHLYDEYGTDCVTHLRGMFAFAIWDARKQQLFLARDRVGQKPLFYTSQHDAFLFASEIKSLLQDPTVTRELNPEALFHYLTYQYIPPPATMFRNICKLPPAHTLLWKNGETILTRYWDLSYVPKVRMDEQELIEHLTHLIQESVKLRMISDVPIGAFLSGGIDSSLVVALMSQYSGQPVKTFSIGFKEKEFNELPYARLIAQRYQTEHHEFIVEPNAVEVLPKLIWHFEEPFGDSSAVPTYYVSQMTSQHVKVALNGDGGDESFAGYERYLGYKIVQYYRILPYRLRKSLLAPLFQSLYSMATRTSRLTALRITLRRMRYLNTLSLESEENLYAKTLTIFPRPLKLELLTDELRQQLQPLNSLEYMFRYFHADTVGHLTDRMLYSDVMTYLPGDLLVKVDRTTMAHGLEGRSPFLDHRLMEWVAKIPPELKMKKTCLKFILKKICTPWLPREILTRKKQGFGVPIGLWFRNELREMLHDILSSSAFVQEGIFKKAVLERILREHQAGEINHQYELWLLLNLELWFRMFLKHG